MESKRFRCFCMVMVAIFLALPAPVQAAEAPHRYTIHQGSWSREDYSQAASPAVFTGPYDRALYDAIRQTLVDAAAQAEVPEDQTAYTQVSKTDYSAVKRLLGRMDGLWRYTPRVPKSLANYYEYPDYFAVSATIPEGYQAILEELGPVIEQTVSMSTGREKVEHLNDHLCALLEYDASAVAAITDVFAPHDAPLYGSCGTYARAFALLCQAAGLPCFTIRTKDHTWDMVYTDGAWGHVDVSLNDLTGSHTMLLTETAPGRTDQAPDQTAFLKELLVPGSTGR